MCVLCPCFVTCAVPGWWAALTEKQIQRGVRRSTRELEEPIRRYVAVINAAPTPFVQDQDGGRNPRQRRALLSSNL